MKNKKKTMNNQKKEKSEKNVRLGKQLREEIDSKFSTHEEFRKACTTISNYNNNSSGIEYISKSGLSNILSGSCPIPEDRAEVFSKVLGVPVTYLLGYDPYPSEEAKEKALLADAMNKWNAEDKDRIDTVRRIMSLLSDRHYQFHFELKEVYEQFSPVLNKKYSVHAVIVSNNMQHTLYIDNTSRTMDDVTFFSWLCNNTLTIKVKDKKKAQYFHLNNKVTVLNNRSHRMIELDVNSFMKMIYDIDESINTTIQTRCDFWHKYSDYDYKDAFLHEYDDIDV